MKSKSRVIRMAVLILTLCLCMGSVCAPVQAASTATQLKNKSASIISKQVKTKDSNKTKLKKLFQYTEKTYGYARTVNFKTSSGWEKTYALQMINNKKGSCYNFAALYGYLAKKATGLPVRIGVGKTNGFSGNLQAHAWVEVKLGSLWYVCDPNMDKFAEESSLKYYMKPRTTLWLEKKYDNYKSAKYTTVKL